MLKTRTKTKYIRRNITLPIDVDRLLKTTVKKGNYSTFISDMLKEKLATPNSYRFLKGAGKFNFDAEETKRRIRKIRKESDRSLYRG